MLASVRCLGMEQGGDSVDHVTHGSHGLELLGRDSAAGDFLKLHHQVERIDAVEIELLVQPGLGPDLLLRHLEHVGEVTCETPIHLVPGQHDGPYLSRFNLTHFARCRTSRKYALTSSVAVSIVIP